MWPADVSSSLCHMLQATPDGFTVASSTCLVTTQVMHANGEVFSGDLPGTGADAGDWQEMSFATWQTDDCSRVDDYCFDDDLVDDDFDDLDYFSILSQSTLISSNGSDHSHTKLGSATPNAELPFTPFDSAAASSSTHQSSFLYPSNRELSDDALVTENPFTEINTNIESPTLYHERHNRLNPQFLYKYTLNRTILDKLEPQLSDELNYYEKVLLNNNDLRVDDYLRSFPNEIKFVLKLGITSRLKLWKDITLNPRGDCLTKQPKYLRVAPFSKSIVSQRTSHMPWVNMSTVNRRTIKPYGHLGNKHQYTVHGWVNERWS